jgi:hypothetical protein
MTALRVILRNVVTHGFGSLLTERLGVLQRCESHSDAIYPDRQHAPLAREVWEIHMCDAPEVLGRSGGWAVGCRRAGDFKHSQGMLCTLSASHLSRGLS